MSYLFAMLFALLIVMSSYIRIYKPFKDAALNYMMGDFTNGYIMNLLVILCYLYIYFRLSQHYNQV